MIKVVVISKRAKQDLQKVPSYIAGKLLSWVNRVEAIGLLEVRKVKRYHDEPLQGQRHGQRSIRLSRSYRAIYVMSRDGKIEFVSIEEVNKHEY